MTITEMRTNHLVNPLGFDMDRPVLTWSVKDCAGKKQEAAQVQIGLDADFSEIVWDSGRKADLSSLGVFPDLEWKPCTRYFWRVKVWTDASEEAVSPAAWFETALEPEAFQGVWIEPPFAKEIHPYMSREIEVTGKVRSARAYCTGLGLYELLVNGRKAGEEYLAPFYNDYDKWIQCQTYDITNLLNEGANTVTAMLGDGWYKGRFGFDDSRALYGDSFKLLCDIRIELEDGGVVEACTDESWLCHPSPVVESSIYDGETYDARKEISLTAPAASADWRKAVLAQAPAGTLTARLSPPLTLHERIAVEKVIATPAGEQVLDFGQETTGWVEFDCDLPEGTQVTLQYGEILQNGNFYNDNLRSAKAEYHYISNGRPAHVRPYFTFYGFRYVKVVGMDPVKPEAFTACVLHSELERTGCIETSAAKINRLFLNALWGQKGNFVDVPTDCPQRDERMGWTGDAQVFSATASFNMYTPAFYKKYLHDMLLEQREQAGAVPHVVPDIIGKARKNQGQKEYTENASCAWADSATVIPWNMYLFYGDKLLLEAQFENMKRWTDYIKTQDDTRCGGRRLWLCGFHFADWLALDNPDKTSCFGGTDCYYIASAYYYFSASLTAKAAQVLGREEEAAYYGGLAGEIRDAFRKEYFTPTGRIAVGTQTAMVVALYLDLVPEEYKERVKEDLRQKLEDNKVHLDTGFVGTPWLCPVLCRNGLQEYAYTLLFNEDFPSWLYEVNMGATTIWERWNSVLPDGMVSDTGMNSLNHYAYGSIVEWMYRYMCGINPVETAPGFKKAVIAPKSDGRLSWVKGSYASAAGVYVSNWKREGGKTVYEVEIPFDAEAEFILEGAAESVQVNGAPDVAFKQRGTATLDAGHYSIEAVYSK